MNQEHVLVHRVAVELFHARLDEGHSVSLHVLHMIDLIEQLRRWNFPLNDMFRRSLRQEGVEEGMELGIKKGIEQGIEQNKIDMIKEMLYQKANYNFISKVSGKSIKEIKSIEKLFQ